MVLVQSVSEWFSGGRGGSKTRNKCMHAYIHTYIHTYMRTGIHACMHASMFFVGNKSINSGGLQQIKQRIRKLYG